jgi:2-polyprenyl-6-methoxyphenol hydroxylase-like FAD-dependent oxidoreductase
MNPNAKVLIVGAGIGGLTLAQALRARGIDYEVFERSAELLPLGAGLLVQPGAMKALTALGLGRRVASAGTELVWGKALTTTGEVLQSSSLAALRDAVHAGTYGLSRARLHQVLLDGLDAVQLGRALVGYEEDEQGVLARFADGSTAYGALLVGADGLRSRVRSSLKPDEPLRYAGYTSWRGIAQHDDAAPEKQIAEIWGRGERFGIVPIGYGETYWFAVANAPEGARDGDPLGEVERRFAGWSDEIRKLLAATPRERVIRADIHDRKPISGWSRGRVTLLGDAAHPMTPNLGQGACMAIEDAVVLARCLHESDDLSAALAAYAAQRLQRTSHMVKSSWQLGRLAQLESPLLIWLRNLALKGTPQAVIQKQMLANANFEA